MTTRDIVWAMHQREHHKLNHIHFDMAHCYDDCVDALTIIEEDHQAKQPK